MLQIWVWYLKKLAFSNILFGCNLPNVSTRWNLLPIHFQCSFNHEQYKWDYFFPQDHLTFSNHVHDCVCVHISKCIHTHTHTVYIHIYKILYEFKNICLIKKRWQDSLQFTMVQLPQFSDAKRGFISLLAGLKWLHIFSYLRHLPNEIILRIIYYFRTADKHKLTSVYWAPHFYRLESLTKVFDSSPGTGIVVCENVSLKWHLTHITGFKFMLNTFCSFCQ